MTLLGGQSVSVGDRFGTVAGSWYGQLCPGGPWEVDQVESQGGGIAVVRAFPILRRLDQVYVVDPAGLASGSYEVVIWGAEVTLAPGTVAGDFVATQG